jgi:Cu2+-containing amine oxidase
MQKRAAILAAFAIAVPAILVTAGLVGATSLNARSRPAAAGGAAAATDPLDPLTADEIKTTFKVIEHDKKLAPGTYFPIVKLEEPRRARPRGRRASSSHAARLQTSSTTGRTRSTRRSST